MNASQVPIGRIMILDILIPPIGTCLWWLMARGWAGFVQLGNISDATKRRQRWEFWIVLASAYLIMFSVTLYGLLR
jgi:hypothetical protein